MMPRLLRRRCPFAAECPFRSDADVDVRRTGSGWVMHGSGRSRPITLVCPLRDRCPLRLSADGGLARVDDDAVEVLSTPPVR